MWSQSHGAATLPALSPFFWGNKHYTSPSLSFQTTGAACDVGTVPRGTRSPPAHPSLTLHFSFQHPYPTEDEKRQIAAQTNLTLLQVNNW